ncbi:MAG: NAD-dependent epimerase/dehydratase family protein [Kofleriaceae bacterium]
MRVAVTGASGFIGHALVLALARRGFGVRAAARRELVVPPQVDVVRHGDLTGPPIDWRPLIAGVDAVVHLAGIAHDSAPPELHDHVNHIQTAGLARAARAAGVAQLVLVSSIHAQSGPTADRILTARDEPRPSDGYGRSKLAAEHAVRASGVPHVILRPALVYGRGVKGNLATLQRIARLPVPLPFATLRNRRSLCALDALVDAIELVLVRRRSDACFLVADAAPIAVRDILAALRRGLGRHPNLFAVPRPVLETSLRIAGRRALWDRIGRELIVDPAPLIALGWRARDSAAGLARIVTRSD